MRKFIDLISEAQTLTESVDFHPAVSSQQDNGRTLIDWPEGVQRSVSEPCRGCNGSGEEYDGSSCEDCGGTKFETYTEYDCPNLNVSSANAALVCKLLGVDWDHAGWVDPLMLTLIRRRLQKVLKDPTHWSEDASDSHSVRNRGSGNADYNNPPFGVAPPLLTSHTELWALEGLMRAADVGDWARFKNAKLNANDEVHISQRGRDKIEQYYQDVLAAAGEQAKSVPANRGARMVSMGISPETVTHYASRLLQIIDWAIANKTGISWG